MKITFSILLCLLLIYVYGIYEPFSFSAPVSYEPQNYSLLLSITLLLFMAVSLIYKSVKTTAEMYAVIIMMIGLILYSIHCHSSDYSRNNQHYSTVCSFVLIGPCAIVFLSKRKMHIVLLSSIIMMVALFFYSTFLLLKIPFFSISEIPIHFNGPFNNSGIFCCYLVFHFPIIAYYIQFCSKRKRLVIFFKTLLLIFFITLIYLCQSRTSLVMLLGSLCFLHGRQLFIVIKSYVCDRGKWLFIICTLLLLGMFLGNIKRGSTNGRILKLQVVSSISPKNFVTGVGFGRFSYFYPHWQSEFFRKNSELNPSLKLSADTSYLSFNEFVELLSEIGIIGFLIIIFILFRPIFIKDDQTFPIMVRCLLLSILISGSTTYTWHCTYFLGALLICLIYLYKQRINSNTINILSRLNYLLGIAIVIIIYFLSFEIRDQYYTAKWKESKLITNTKQRITEMRSIYPYMNNRGRFLVDFANLLQTSDSAIVPAIKMYIQSEKYVTSYEVQLALAQCFKRTGNLKEAFDRYLWFSYYVPNKFTPKYEMMQLAQRLNYCQTAKEIANQILEQPVKISSNRVTQIKKEAEIFLNGKCR